MCLRAKGGESIRDIRDIRDKAGKTEGFLSFCIRDSIRDIRDIRDRGGNPESKVQSPKSKDREPPGRDNFVCAQRVFGKR